MTTILSIQSHVAYGHVGNSASVFPMQRLGVEVWPVHTVNFSNHTGYGAWRGPLMDPADVADVITGIGEREAFAEVDAVLSGYQGGEGIGATILEAVAAVKAANPEAIYACDPVMGNAKSGCFVHESIPVLLREQVVPQADLITPNQFELGFLTGTEPETLEETLASVDAARAMGPSTILVTSVLRPDRPEGTIEMLACHEDEAWIVRTPTCRSRPMAPATSRPRSSRATGCAAATCSRRSVPRSPPSSTCCSSRSTRVDASCSWCRRRRPTPTRACSSRSRGCADAHRSARWSRWMTSRSYCGPISLARSLVPRPMRCGSSPEV